MYYPYIKMILKKSSLCSIILFAAFTLAISCQSASYANSLTDQAKEYRDRGYSIQLSGDIENAGKFYQKAIDTDPTFAAAYNDLGVIAELRDNIDEAEANYSKAIELDNSYLAAYSNMAYLYEKKGNLIKAAIFWKKRIDKGSPGDLWAVKAKDNLQRLSSVSAAVKDMCLQDEAVEFAAQIQHRKINEFRQKVILAKEHFEKGEALYKAKEFTAALVELRIAQKLTPDDQKINKAIEEAAQDLSDSQVNEYANSGLKYYQTGDYLSARNEFKKLLAVMPAPSNPKGIDLTYPHKQGSNQKSK